jgi:hypothetical protein
MTAPTVTASFNKTTYAPGETMLLNVNYSDADTKTLTITTTVTDSTGATATATATAVIDPVSVSVVSNPTRTWTKVSDTAGVAVFSATA